MSRLSTKIKLALYIVIAVNVTLQAHRLTPEELAKREVIYIDIANDTIRSADYKVEEDPAKFHSQKTGRGPLAKDWKVGTID